MIKSIEKWVSNEKEVRIYATTSNGYVGCLYVTGNCHIAPGTLGGTLSIELWNEIKDIAFDGNEWHSINV